MAGQDAPAGASTTGRQGLAGGRDLTPAVGFLAFAVACVAGVAGLLLVGCSLLGVDLYAWPSPERLSTGLIGAAMAGVAPGLLRVNGARQWEQARSVVWPVAIAVVGLCVVSLLHTRDLAYHDGNLLVAGFSLGWVAVLAALSVFTLIALARQYAEPALPPDPKLAPVPRWAAPLLALLGSGWFGLGVGLLVRPSYWGALVPWRVSHLDAESFGVWALALGTGILGALADDDFDRLRPALLAVLGVGVMLTVVLIVRSETVAWTSGPGVCLAVLVGGLLLTGVVGTWLRRRAVV